MIRLIEVERSRYELSIHGYVAPAELVDVSIRDIIVRGWVRFEEGEIRFYEQPEIGREVLRAVWDEKSNSWRDLR